MVTSNYLSFLEWLVYVSFRFENQVRQLSSVVVQTIVDTKEKKKYKKIKKWHIAKRYVPLSRKTRVSRETDISASLNTIMNS